jgi:hypothetical protein
MKMAIEMFVLGEALISVPFCLFRQPLFYGFFEQRASSLVPANWFLIWFILVQTAGVVLLAHLVYRKHLVISFFSVASIACSSLMILIVGWTLFFARPAVP